MNTNQDNGSNSHLDSVSEDTTKNNTDNDNLKVGICSQMSNQLIEDLFVTAIEGGSNDWYFINGEFDTKGEPLSTYLIRKVLSDPTFEITISDVEEGIDDILGKVNQANIIEAEKLLQGSHPGQFKQIIDENWDAFHADTWFQLVVMQKVVYG